MRRGRGEILDEGLQDLAGFLGPALMLQREAVAQQPSRIDSAAGERQSADHARHGDLALAIQLGGDIAGVDRIGAAPVDIGPARTRDRQGLQDARVVHRLRSPVGIAIGQPRAGQPVARLVVGRLGGDEAFEDRDSGLGIAGEERLAAGLQIEGRNVHRVRPSGPCCS
jgi:hypothetical protein